MAINLQGDENLSVSFSTRQITKGKPRNEEWVRIANPADLKSVFMARAASVSHVDDRTGYRVTYAERFPTQYAEYKTGKGKNIASQIANLEAQLAAAKSARGDVVEPATAELVVAAAKPVDPNAAPNFEAMDDDDLREFIFDKTGKEVSANISRRETLIEKAQEALKG